MYPDSACKHAWERFEEVYRMAAANKTRIPRQAQLLIPFEEIALCQ